MQRNALNKQIGEKRKVRTKGSAQLMQMAIGLMLDIYLMLQKKEDATELQEKSVALKKQTEEAEVTKNSLESKRDKAMIVIGNLVHDSVPVNNDEVMASAALTCSAAHDDKSPTRTP